MFYYSFYTPFFITSTEITKYFASNIIIWITNNMECFYWQSSFCYTNFSLCRIAMYNLCSRFISNNIYIILIGVLVHISVVRVYPFKDCTCNIVPVRIFFQIAIVHLLHKFNNSLETGTCKKSSVSLL